MAAGSSLLVVGFVLGLRIEIEILVGLGGDIVEIAQLIVLEVVDRVNAAARALLDRAAGAVFLLSAFLAAKPFGRCWGTEVRAPVASARSGWAGP
jgi:hypothetical protein